MAIAMQWKVHKIHESPACEMDDDDNSMIYVLKTNVNHA